MKIKSIVPILVSSKYGDGKVLGQPLGVKTLGLVKIELENGIIGYGESYCGIYIPEIFKSIIEYISHILVGSELENPIEIYKKFHIPFVSSSGIFKSAYSGFDIALWNIFSQIEEKSIQEIISGKGNVRDTVQVYASGGSAAFDPMQIEKDLVFLLSQGHTHYKMRVGFQSWEQDIARIIKAKSILSSGSSLMVDAIMGTINPPWNLKDAQAREIDLQDFNLEWLEEPLFPTEFGLYKKLTSESKTKIAAGEALTSQAEFESFISLNAVDIIQPDATHCGGISAAVEICHLAKLHKMPVALHVWGSPIAFFANYAVAASFDQVEWLEIPSVKLEISEKISEKLSIEKGKLALDQFKQVPIKITDQLLSDYQYVPGSGFQFPK
jgi:L-alanine-DL-glutamate epimerase-like enolase superfamily enzyme